MADATEQETNQSQAMTVSLTDPHTAFINAYWAAQHPEVQALRDMPEPDAFNKSRIAAAQALAAKGFLIDEDIHVTNANPYWAMWYRVRYGFTWIPNMNQANIVVAPGLNIPGVPPYDPLHPPPGAIQPISTNPADFPPFPKPEPVKPSDPTSALSPVERDLGHDKWYAAQWFDHWPVGSITGSGGVPSDPRGVFVKSQFPNWVAWTYVWVKQ